MTDPAPVDYRIDELARAAGTTVRNVRAYQERGLLAPPRRQGRVGLYSDAHLARLRVIGALLERGYSLQNIGELVGAWERGDDLGDLLGLAIAVASPFGDEVPALFSGDELGELFGIADAAEVLGEALDLGLLEVDGDRFRAPSPRLLHAGAELHRAGVPLPALLAEVRRLRRDIDAVAERFVDLVATHVFGPFGDLPPTEVLGELAQVVQRLRPLAEMVVDSELARALERHARSQLGERLTRLVDAETADSDEP